MITVLKVNVTDVVKASAWYTDKLNFEQFENYQNEFVQMRIPGMACCSYVLQKSETDTPSLGAATWFLVGDVAQTKKFLEAKGVQVGQIMMSGKNVPLALFEDPYGNILGLRQTDL